MAKLLLLVVALCIGSNFQVNAQFGSMFGIGDIIRDIGGEVHHVWERFFKEPDERYVKDQVKKIEQIKNNLKANGKSLDNSEELTKLILQQLGDADDKSRDLDERLVRLNDTFTLVDLKIDIVTSRINEISMLISDIPATVAERASFLLSGFLNRIRVQRNLIEVKELFKTYVRTIDINYNNFLLYTKPGANVRRDSMLEFCDNLLSPYADELSKTLVRIHKLLAPGETESIYDGLLEFLRDFQSKQTFDERCDLETSFQEQFRELYHIILVSEIRAFTMQAFAMNYRHMVGEETEAAVKGEVGMMIESLLKRMSSYLAAMKGTMDGVSRELFRCEPQKHLLGETSFRVNDLFGMYYINKKQLNPLVSKYPAEINTLSYFECLDRYAVNDAFINFYCPRYQCIGRLHKCKEAGSFNFCEARAGANRRYGFTLDGKKFPKRPFDCNGRFVDTLAKETDNLLCQCSEEGAESLATKAINLMPQMSDIENNMVVTNVRFLKKNNMIHLQIEEGLLLPDGNIDKATVSSVPVGNFRYLQNSTQGSFVQLDPAEWDDRQILLTYDRDYTFLYHNRSTINLDDIVVDKGYVVTGVKFDTEENNPGIGINYSPIQLKVHGTPFDYDTGLLIPTAEKPSKWFTPFDMKGRIKRYSYMREMLDISDSDDSIKSTGAVQQSLTNFQVTFQVTSWEKDMGQTVVPYFDTLSAAVSNGVALDGIGIFHRGSPGFGGFIAPKIFNVDHAHYIRPEISEYVISKYKKSWY